MKLKKDNKAFTLVELLAVIVILAIIVVLAYTRIKGFMKKSNQSTAETNAKVFVKAVNEMAQMSIKEPVKYIEGSYSVSELMETGNVKVNGTIPSGGYINLEDFEVTDACLLVGKYSVEFENGQLKKSTLNGDCNGDPIEPTVFAYTGAGVPYTVTQTGKYKIELWGAAGGNDSLIAAGAYTSGDIKLKQGDIIYFYVGQKTISTSLNTATFNGGGSCSGNCSSGGGATDVRLISGTWDDSASLASRIMVAAGGGGNDPYSSGYVGSVGGALTSSTGAGDTPTTGATQTSAGINSSNSARNGSFGKGATGEDWGGGGGGGYYGGAAGINSGTGNGGTGGSSYISGYTGCVAIASATNIAPKPGCSNGTTDNDCSVHYSGTKFTNAVMKAGNESMPTFDGNSTMTGNTDNGYARISYLGR